MRAAMKLESVAFGNDDWIPTRYTCEGEGVIPPLYWQDVPPEVKSLVLLVKQQEAPEGKAVHWLVYDLPVTPNVIHEGGVLPATAKVGRNDFGELAYQPPCHRPDHQLVYFDFILYAIDLPTLGLAEGASWSEVKDRLRASRSPTGTESSRYNEHVDLEAPPYQDKMAREWHELGHVMHYATMGAHFAKNTDTHVPGVDQN